MNLVIDKTTITNRISILLLVLCLQNHRLIPYSFGIVIPKTALAGIRPKTSH